MFTITLSELNPPTPSQVSSSLAKDQNNCLSLCEAAPNLALYKVSLSSNLSNTHGQDNQDPALLNISLISFSKTDFITKDKLLTQFIFLFKSLFSPYVGASIFNAEFHSIPNIHCLDKQIISKWALATSVHMT